MKEIDASIDRGEGGEEKEKERKEKESVYTEIFSILNKNGLGKGKTDLKTILFYHTCKKVVKHYMMLMLMYRLIQLIIIIIIVKMKKK